MNKNLTSGNLLKTMISFSLPFLLSYFLQTLYGMADLFIIGQFNGVESTTAVSIGSQVMHMVTVILVGLAMGSTVLIGRAVGAEKSDETGQIIGNTLTLFLGLSLALSALTLFFVQGIVSIMSTPLEATVETAAYLRLCFLGIPFITAYNILSSIFRGLGDSKTPMYFVAVSCAVNIALDYLFIGGLGMGASGAALGTVLSQTCSVLLALWVIRRRQLGIRLSAANLRPQATVMRQLLRIGLPVAAQDGLIQVSFLIITIIANHRGLSDAAAVGIVEKIISFIFLVPSTLLSTVSALSAQNIGAGRHDRVQKTLGYAIGMSCLFGIAISLVIQLRANAVVSLFSTDPSVILGGGQYIRSYVLDCFFAGIHFSFSGYFCAYGKSELSFLHNILSIVCVRIPLAYFFSASFPHTLYPMGFASALGSLFSVVLCLLAYGWLHKRHPQLFSSHISPET